ncbi:zinc finger-containing ubiquitin peptidase 1 [Aplochiton taeniatus]
MLTCEICGEELVFEEDMKTHLLLSHLESEMSCPLCSLSGVSYDELNLHINTAHPESQDIGVGETGRPTAGGTAPDTETTPAAAVAKESPEAALESVRLCEDAETGPNRSEHTKAKQKRLSSLLKDKEFPCPMCALVCSDCFILQEHVELHLQETNAVEGVKSYQCPICSLVCINSHSLQEHVELHLDCGAASNFAGNSGIDHMLAKRLQQEEDQRRKAEEATLEAEEFKKLQKQFGLDGSGGYRKQMERNLEKAVSRGHMVPAEFHTRRAEMMEALATGVDDCRTRTQGLLGALYEYYQKEGRDCVHVWLSAETDHFCSSEGDKGWGCGYRNLQMLLSSLQRQEPFATILPGTVPNIPQVQGIIEGAWREGLDPQGATHFNQRLQGTRAWIGATEIYAVLTSLGVRSHMVDFHQPTGPGDTHPRLFEWVKEYFSQSACRATRLPPRVVPTTQPPLYLQHQGHSRSIVGLEQRKNGSLCLLMLDPGCSPTSVRKLFVSDCATTAVRRMRKFPGNLKHKQYQVVVVEGVLSPEEKQTCILNSKTLCAERIP